jgi:glycosyltransferase involved in cell wall biosynthesis
MYQNRKISVILPTYREKDSIRRVISDFESLGVVDEILVINNKAIEGTSDEVRQTSALEIREPLQGYGAAIRRGFAEATGDLMWFANLTALLTQRTSTSSSFIPKIIEAVIIRRQASLGNSTERI